ncbi:DUF2947 family protein [Thalassotalea sp. PLHSN55]|uniref:DUF2947 family protein n=1 Tax=Thalassotalea sp. PLHSN55 TaxID=3435888 RepID=UPI003F878E35
MNYISIEELKNAWIFRHNSLPVAEKDLTKIKPMTAARANTLWDVAISRQVDHPDFFKKGDWPVADGVWFDNGKWETLWDSDEPDLPELILSQLHWDNNTVVYYCCNRNYVIETTWQVFKRTWKNFLFMDDGALLIGKKRQETVQFNNNGYFKIGKKAK